MGSQSMAFGETSLVCSIMWDYWGKKMETVTLNEKGQVTIPARIRKARGLRKGVRLAIVEIGDRIELVVNEVPTSILHRAAELKKRYFKRSERTFFSLYDALHLALAEKHCEFFLKSDSDFRDVKEVKV